jgi:hypothetical protein
MGMAIGGSRVAAVGQSGRRAARQQSPVLVLADWPLKVSTTRR